MLHSTLGGGSYSPSRSSATGEVIAGPLQCGEEYQHLKMRVLGPLAWRLLGVFPPRQPVTGATVRDP